MSWEPAFRRTYCIPDTISVVPTWLLDLVTAAVGDKRPCNFDIAQSLLRNHISGVVSHAETHQIPLSKLVHLCDHERIHPQLEYLLEERTRCRYPAP